MDSEVSQPDPPRRLASLSTGLKKSSEALPSVKQKGGASSGSCSPRKGSTESKIVRFSEGSDDVACDILDEEARAPSKAISISDTELSNPSASSTEPFIWQDIPVAKLVDQLRITLGERLCQEVRNTFAEEAEKWHDHLDCIRKELVAAGRLSPTSRRGASCPGGKSRYGSSGSGAKQGENDLREHCGTRESFESVVSSNSLSETSGEEGSDSGQRVDNEEECLAEAKIRAMLLASNPRVLSSGQVATCPELVTLERDPSRTPSTTAESNSGGDMPECSANALSNLKAFQSEDRSVSKALASIQALMRLPTEEEKEKNKPPPKMRHPAQVETYADLPDVIGARQDAGDMMVKTISEADPAARDNAPLQAMKFRSDPTVVRQSSSQTRARMIGVPAPRAGIPDAWARPVEGKGQLASLEKNLARELFRAKALEPSVSGNSSEPSPQLRWPLPSQRKAKGQTRYTRSKGRAKSPKGDASRNFTDVLQSWRSPTGPSPTTGEPDLEQATKLAEDAAKDSQDKDGELAVAKSTSMASMASTDSKGDVALSTRNARSLEGKQLPSARALRQQRESQITQALNQDLPSETQGQEEEHFKQWAQEQAIRVVLSLPKLIGALPWLAKWKYSSMAYQHAIMTATVFVASTCVQNAVDQSNVDKDEEMPLSPVLDTIASTGACLAVISCGFFTQRKVVVESMKLLVNAARRDGFAKQWRRESCWDTLACMSLWLMALVARGMNSFDRNWALFAIASLVITGMACTILHCCRCMAKMVDNFCYRILESPDYGEAMQEWNLFQALCRTSSGSMQFAFISLQAVAAAAVLLTIAEVQRGFSGLKEMLPGLFIALQVTFLSFAAASVTDKCARVPILVNSMSSHSDLGQDRMYMVEYIVHSQAGFYVFEVRLTSSTVMKMLYVACAVAFGLASQLL